MKTSMLFFIGLSGFLGVALGAFGAHALKPYLDSYQIQIYEKGIQYHFIHTLAAAFAMVCFFVFHQKNFKIIALLFLIGILFFSGSLYLLAIRSLLPFNISFVGPITPIGGLFFLFAWAWLAKESLTSINQK